MMMALGIPDFSDYPYELPIGTLRLELQAIIKHYAEVFQCPVDFITSTVLEVASTICGKHVILDNGVYRNYPNQWMCHIATSGTNKSAPVKALLEPLFDENKRLFERFQEKEKLFEMHKEEEKPKFIPLIVSDVTPEGLYQTLSERNDSNKGLLLYRDEIKGFIDDFGRYNKSGEVSTYLSIWDGTSFPILRKTQSPMYIYDPFLCIMGGIQPELFGEVFSKRLAESGFVQRWLFVYPGETIGGLYSKRKLDPLYKKGWEETVLKLLNMPKTTLVLSPEAEQVYESYYNETRVKECGIDTHIYVRSMLSKLRIQVLKLSAVTHMLSCSDNAGMGQNFILPKSNVVTGDEMRYSVDCMHYFEYCGHKALSLIKNVKTQNRDKKLLIADLVFGYGGPGNVNLSQLASSIGVQRQYVSKVVHEDPRIQGCGCDNTRSSPFKGEETA